MNSENVSNAMEIKLQRPLTQSRYPKISTKLNKYLKSKKMNTLNDK